MKIVEKSGFLQTFEQTCEKKCDEFCEDFEFGAVLWDFPGGFSPGSFPLGIPKVQRNANLVDLENPCKMRLFSLS